MDEAYDQPVERPVANEDDPREKATQGCAPARRAFSSFSSSVRFEKRR